MTIGCRICIAACDAPFVGISDFSNIARRCSNALRGSARNFLLHATIVAGIFKIAAFAYASVTPLAGAIAFIVFPVNGSPSVLIVTSYVRYVAIIVVINIIVTRIMGVIKMVMQPRVVNITVYDHDERVVQVETGIHHRQAWREKPLTVIKIYEIARGQIVIRFDVGEVIITCSHVIIGSPNRVVIVIVIVLTISRCSVI